MNKLIIRNQLDRFEQLGTLEFYDQNQALRLGQLAAFNPGTGECTFINRLGEVFKSSKVR